jgi:hypothetical protein
VRVGIFDGVLGYVKVPDSHVRCRDATRAKATAFQLCVTRHTINVPPMVKAKLRIKSVIVLATDDFLNDIFSDFLTFFVFVERDV